MSFPKRSFTFKKIRFISCILCFDTIYEYLNITFDILLKDKRNTFFYSVKNVLKNQLQLHNFNLFETDFKNYLKSQIIWNKKKNNRALSLYNHLLGSVYTTKKFPENRHGDYSGHARSFRTPSANFPMFLGVNTLTKTKCNSMPSLFPLCD